MTQPQPDLAAALRSFEIPADLSQAVRLRDFMLNVAENGVPAEAGVQYVQELLHLLAFAQLESTGVVIHLNNSIRQLEQYRQTLQATLASWGVQ